MLYYFISRYVPESLRWLQLKGRHEEVGAIFQKISRVNKRDMPDYELNDVKDETQQGLTHFLNIFRPKKIAIRSLIQGYLW